MGPIENQITKQQAIAKILVIREQMDIKEREIAELNAKRKKMWDEIKDFTVDAIRADKGYKYMSKLFTATKKLQKSVDADKKKIKKLEKGKDE